MQQLDAEEEPGAKRQWQDEAEVEDIDLYDVDSGDLAALMAEACLAACAAGLDIQHQERQAAAVEGAAAVVGVVAVVGVAWWQRSINFFRNHHCNHHHKSSSRNSYKQYNIFSIIRITITK